MNLTKPILYVSALAMLVAGSCVPPPPSIPKTPRRVVVIETYRPSLFRCPITFRYLEYPRYSIGIRYEAHRTLPKYPRLEKFKKKKTYEIRQKQKKAPRRQGSLEKKVRKR